VSQAIFRIAPLARPDLVERRCKGVGFGDLIGSGAAREEAVVGETPNLAARLQALAEPDAVVIAETARGGGAQRQPKRERSREPTVNRKWGTQCH